MGIRNMHRDQPVETKHARTNRSNRATSKNKHKNTKHFIKQNGNYKDINTYCVIEHHQRNKAVDTCNAISYQKRDINVHDTVEHYQRNKTVETVNTVSYPKRDDD